MSSALRQAITRHLARQQADASTLANRIGWPLCFVRGELAEMSGEGLTSCDAQGRLTLVSPNGKAAA